MKQDHHIPKLHHRRRWILGGAVVVPLVLAAAAVIVLTRDEAEQVSLSDASRRFEDSHPAVSADGGVLAPAEGVYEYRGHGSDSLSVLPFEQSHGPVMPGTVEHTEAGCWTFRIDYSTHHWQDWTYCPRPDRGLDETAGRTFQRWDVGVTSIDNRSSFTCASATLVPGMQPGDHWPQRCVGGSDQIAGRTVSAGRTRYRGTSDVVVGGEHVQAYHLVQDRAVTGAQRGTERSELWLAPNGLPLREKHTIAVKSGSPLGDVTYDEVTDFRLRALEPLPPGR
jgi:hypothetical protein